MELIKIEFIILKQSTTLLRRTRCVDFRGGHWSATEACMSPKKNIKKLAKLKVVKELLTWANLDDLQFVAIDVVLHHWRFLLYDASSSSPH